ncbi:unnamed protein product [Oncorhynchus mykiss]|uniref:Uncharacterized protein n=1 Tax=Oncorhynchus mykiss TaxID=8022 RepID=A0A060YKU1_ONCMY|nr:unnamed protein product [Oncorhynchus mykiss]
MHLIFLLKQTLQRCPSHKGLRSGSPISTKQLVLVLVCLDTNVIAAGSGLLSSLTLYVSLPSLDSTYSRLPIQHHSTTDSTHSRLPILHHSTADYPYCITPQQINVPAGGSSTIHVSFTPLTLSELTSNAACVSFALGFMSLDSKVSSCIPGKVQRAQGQDLEPLRLDLQASVRPAV